MVAFVLIIGMLNVSLGFALAIYLEYLTAPEREIFIHPEVPVKEDDNDSSFGTSLLPSSSPVTKKLDELSLEDVEELPEAWLEVLDGARETNSLVEAAAEVLRLEVGKYREQLVRLDTAIRDISASGDYSSLEERVQQIKELNEEWLETQTGALNHLTDRQDNLGDNAVVGAALEDVLLDQSAQIETTISNIKMLDPASDPEGSCTRLITESARLVDLAHALRDRMIDSVAVILRSEDRLISLDEGLGTDGLTGLLGRVGTEAVFDQWQRDPTNKTRTASVALMNIDTFSQFNRKYGFVKGDELIGEIGRILPGMVRKERGLDRTARIDGNTYLIFFGDTGPRNALSVMERIRQTIAGSTIQLLDDTFEITARVAVCELQHESSPALLRRLRAALRHAKAKGGNTAVVDEGEGPKSTKPPEFNVQGKTITLMN